MIWGISNPTVESVLLRHAQSAGIDVRRRCVDAVELLAASAVSPGAPVLVDMNLSKLSREVLAAIMDHTDMVTILASTDRQYSLARSWGLSQVVRFRDSANADVPSASELEAHPDSYSTGSIDVEEVINVIGQSMHRVENRPVAREGLAREGLAGEGLAGEGLAREGLAREGLASNGGAHVVCMWSATGSTGRSTLAIGLAEAWARDGERVLLIDADTSAPSLATALGVTDDLSGIVVACRYADQNSLDQRSLSSACRELKNNLWVLTGISDPQRWPEVAAASLGSVIDRARDFFDRIVIDISPIVVAPADQADSMDLVDSHYVDPLARLRPIRNMAGLAALKAADTVMVVIRPDAVGALRLVHDFGSHSKYFANARTAFLVNRVNPKHRNMLHREFDTICAGLAGRGSLSQKNTGRIQENNQDRAHVPLLIMVPEDPVAETMIKTSATMAEVRINSKIFRALRKAAGQLKSLEVAIHKKEGSGTAARQLRRRQHYNKITDFRPLVKLFGIFGRHPHTSAAGNR
jgi:hypothetical protein